MPVKIIPAKNTIIPSFSLYGEQKGLLDILHCELILNRAKNLDWSIKPHRHSNLHQFFLLSDGSASLVLDNVPHQISGPTLISVPRMNVHSFEFALGTIGYVLSIPTNVVAQIVEQDPELSLVENRAVVMTADENFSVIFKQIYNEYWSNDRLKVPLLRTLCTLLFCHFARQYPRELDHDQPNHYSLDIRKFDDLIRLHMAQCWNVSDYAVALGYSRTHLNRICRAATGHSPRSYINVFTLQEARRLLTYTDLDIATVGYRLGFDDPSYFSRSFKRLIGVSPKEYRVKESLTG